MDVSSLLPHARSLPLRDQERLLDPHHITKHAALCIRLVWRLGIVGHAIKIPMHVSALPPLSALTILAWDPGGSGLIPPRQGGLDLKQSQLRKAIRITRSRAKRQTQNAKRKTQKQPHIAPHPINFFLVLIAYIFRAFLTNNSGYIFLDSRLLTLNS
jgi:hypothetical protein